MSASLLGAIDDFRWDQRVKSRSEAIRQLLQRALEMPGAEAREQQPRPRPKKR